MTIGRAPSCTIEVDDSYASAVHTRINQRDDGWYVDDLGSTNGTYLNRRKVSAPTRLAVGDQISVGNLTWEVR
jgi:pSer/pThr/pTyr-binding forkhead associated (FHA) protein